MTDMNEQQEILDAIEHLLAGEPMELEGVQKKKKEQLLALAQQLHQERPQPATEFEAQLSRKLEQESVRAPAAESKAATRERRWLPPWLTLPRAAAVAATLVLGLGIAGLTGALLTGQGTDKMIEKNRAAQDTSAGFETDAMESPGRDRDAAGVAGSINDTEAAGPFAGEEKVPMAGSAGSGGASIPSIRQVIQSADYEIEVPGGEFQDKYGKVTALAAKYGGYVVAANTSASDDEGAINSGTVTIRIADNDDNFARAMSELDELGKIASRDVSGQDVTEQYVDLQSRLRNAQAHEASLLGLMERANTIEEMLLVQSELNTVRAEIEQLQGQINYIADRSDFATISVYMYEDGVVKDEDGGDGTEWGFIDSLEYAGWLAVQTVNFVIIALGVIIPVAIILILVIVVVYRLMRRRRSLRK